MKDELYAKIEEYALAINGDIGNMLSPCQILELILSPEFLNLLKPLYEIDRNKVEIIIDKEAEWSMDEMSKINRTLVCNKIIESNPIKVKE